MTIDGIALLLMIALGPDTPAPACQRETIVELFRLVSTGSGSIADRDRLWADQAELEGALVTCAMFPESIGGEPTREQAREVKRVLQNPKKHRSEVFAFLRYRWPELFSKAVTPTQVSGPIIGPRPTLEYRVRIDNNKAVRVFFEAGSCHIISVIAPEGQEVLSKPDCHWRRKAR